MSLLEAFVKEAGKYGKLVRPDSQEKDKLICQEVCPYCHESLRWHLPDGIFGRVFFVCDKCNRWFFVVGVYGSWEVIRDGRGAY